MNCRMFRINRQNVNALFLCLFNVCGKLIHIRLGFIRIQAVIGLGVGMVDTDGKTYFRIAVKDGYVNLLSIQLAGKKRMSVGDFLRGYRHVEKTWVE